MKKLVCILLCLVMVLGVLAGCAKTETKTNETKKEETKTETKKEETKKEDSKTEEKKEEEIPQWKVDHPGWLCEEKQTITVLTYDGVNSTYLPPSNDVPFWQWLEEWTNVHVEWDIATYTGYKDIITARLAGGDALADIIMLYTADIANDAGVNGIVANLSDYWDTCFTNIQNYFDGENMAYKSALTNEDGSCYAIATLGSPIENHIFFLYNTEWMKKLGAKVPTNLDEFTALCEQMKAAGDINGNGEDDEVILSAAEVDHLRSVLNLAFDMEHFQGELCYSADANGKVYNCYTSDNMKAELAYINELYEKGYLDPEIATMSYDKLSEKVSGDRVGIMAIYTSFAISYGKLTTKGQADPTGEWYTIGVPLASDWVKTPYISKGEGSYSMYTGVNSKAADVELCCKWLDALYADPKVLEVRTLGWEGETFQWNAEKTDFDLILPADGSSWSIIKKGCGQLALPYVQTAQQLMASKKTTPWYVAQYANLRENYEWRNHTITPVAVYNEAETEINSLYKNDVQTGWKEYRDKFITGQLDIEKDWDSYVKTMQALGVDELAKCFQSIYDRTK